MNFSPNMVFLNRSFDKKRLKALLLWFRLNLSEGAALEAVEILQGLGFRSATQGAISLGLDDLKTPASKGGRVFQAQLDVSLAYHEHHRGNRTPVELFQHLVDTWHRTSQDLTAEVVKLFHSTERVNPVYMMAFSGARGNLSQVRQLVAMRGLMADPRGQIVGFPILSNFREGLTITEYFVSCYGARKGVVDTAIRTADAGYLTRRLADVSHHFVVRTTNCGTHRTICLRDIKEGEKTILPLVNRLVGRVLGEHISKIASRNEEITPALAPKLASQYDKVFVRSPLSCSLRWGVCQLCYGWGLSEGRRVTLGEAVGIIAAQSIGEPGTQLTLRTFHTGGVFSGDLLSEIRAPYNGTIFFPEPLQGLLVRTPHGQIAFLAKVFGKMFVLHDGFSASSMVKSKISNQKLRTMCATERITFVESNDSLHASASEDDCVSSDALKSPTIDLKSKIGCTEIVSEAHKDTAIDYSSINSVDLQKLNTEVAERKKVEFSLQPSTVIFVRQKEQVHHNQLLAEFSSSTLQPINDQIEVTQQVLSETAGQVWFKEIQYGNRRGPGSGSLGTHFSSQKLGGIWVLAGKPKLENLVNDRKQLSINFSTLIGPDLTQDFSQSSWIFNVRSKIQNFCQQSDLVNKKVYKTSLVNLEHDHKSLKYHYSLGYLQSVNFTFSDCNKMVSIYLRGRLVNQQSINLVRKSIKTADSFYFLPVNAVDLVHKKSSFANPVHLTSRKSDKICAIEDCNEITSGESNDFKPIIGCTLTKGFSAPWHRGNAVKIFGEKIPVSWCFKKKWKITSGLLLAEPFFANKEKTQGQLFCLSSKFLQQKQSVNLFFYNPTLVKPVQSLQSLIVQIAQVANNHENLYFINYVNKISEFNFPHFTFSPNVQPFFYFAGGSSFQYLGGQQDYRRYGETQESNSFAITRYKFLHHNNDIGPSIRNLIEGEQVDKNIKKEKVVSNDQHNRFKAIKKDELVFHDPLDSFFQRRKLQNVPVIRKIVEPLTLNRRHFSVTNRVIFSPVNENYTCGKLTTLLNFKIPHFFIKNENVSFALQLLQRVGHQTEDLKKVSQSNAEVAQFASRAKQVQRTNHDRNLGTILFRESIMTTVLCSHINSFHHAPAIQSKIVKKGVKSKISNQKIVAASPASKKLRHYASLKLLTFNPFWQPLSLANYPNKISKNNKSKYFYNWSNVNNVTNSGAFMASSKLFTEQFNSQNKLYNVASNQKVRFVRHNKRKGKRKTIFLQKPIWLSVNIDNSNCTNLIESIDSWNVKQKFEKQFIKSIDPLQLVTEGITNVGQSTKYVERNDSSLDQHIVHTITLPLVSFPYIIPPNCANTRYNKQLLATDYRSPCGTPVQGKILPLIRHSFWEDSLLSDIKKDLALGVLFLFLGITDQKVQNNAFAHLMQKKYMKSVVVHQKRFKSYLQSLQPKVFGFDQLCFCIEDAQPSSLQSLQPLVAQIVQHKIASNGCKNVVGQNQPSLVTSYNQCDERLQTRLYKMHHPESSLVFKKAITVNNISKESTTYLKSNISRCTFDQRSLGASGKIKSSASFDTLLCNQSLQPKGFLPLQIASGTGDGEICATQGCTDFKPLIAMISPEIEHNNVTQIVQHKKNKIKDVGSGANCKPSYHKLVDFNDVYKMQKAIEILSALQRKNVTLFTFISPLKKKIGFDKLALRVSDIHFTVSLPIKTITNLKGRYTSAYLKLPKNNLVVNSYIYKKPQISAISQRLWTGKINRFLLMVLATPYILSSGSKMQHSANQQKQFYNLSLITAASTSSLLQTCPTFIFQANGVFQTEIKSDAVSNQIFGLKSLISRKKSNLLQEIPQTYSLMRRVVEYPIKRSVFKVKRKEIKYQPFFTGLISPSSDALACNQSLLSPKVIPLQPKVFGFDQLCWSLSSDAPGCNQSLQPLQPLQPVQPLQPLQPLQPSVAQVIQHKESPLVKAQIVQYREEMQKKSVRIVQIAQTALTSFSHLYESIFSAENVKTHQSKKSSALWSNGESFWLKSNPALFYNITKNAPVPNKVWITKKKFTSIQQRIYLEWYAFAPNKIRRGKEFTRFFDAQERNTLVVSQKETSAQQIINRVCVVPPGQLKATTMVKDSPLFASPVHQQISPKQSSIPYLGESDQITFIKKDSILLRNEQKKSSPITFWQSPNVTKICNQLGVVQTTVLNTNYCATGDYVHELSQNNLCNINHVGESNWEKKLMLESLQSLIGEICTDFKPQISPVQSILLASSMYNQIVAPNEIEDFKKVQSVQSKIVTIAMKSPLVKAIISNKMHKIASLASHVQQKGLVAHISNQSNKDGITSSPLILVNTIEHSITNLQHLLQPLQPLQSKGCILPMMQKVVQYKMLDQTITKSKHLFPGQLVAYGEKIDENIATTESGQILYVDLQKIILRKAQTVLIYSQAILSVLSREWITKGTPLMALSYQKLVTGDIVQGLPKIEQFFEAPLLKDGTFWSDSLQAKLNLFFQEHREKLPLAEAVRKGFLDIQRVLVEGVQRVYISQGVLIADKHLEVIVRQMTFKGRILYSGDTGFLRNELVALDKIESVNQVTYGQKALYHPQVRGITDASLESESFLSAASFQETTRVLSRDAIIGKTDLMRGLKERVIVGELIQAGTGLANNNVYSLLPDSNT